jgi:hypothetical protein
MDLAQALLDSSNITVPSGLLTDGAYDELGCKYIIPAYCISEPTNLLPDTQVTPANSVPIPEELRSEPAAQVDPSSSKLVGRFTTSRPGDYSLVFRLSTSKDIALRVIKSDTIESICQYLRDKEQLHHAKLLALYLGKSLDSNVKMGDLNVDSGGVVQVMIYSTGT